MTSDTPAIIIHAVSGCEHLMAVHRIAAEAPSVAGPYDCEFCDCRCEQGAASRVISDAEAERRHQDELVWLGLQSARAPS